MSGAENIKVAVRVRPFSTREKNRNANLIVNMTNQTTAVYNPNNPKEEPKKFTYDHSYWSHDGYKAADDGYLQPANKKYVDQNCVFRDLGIGMLRNAWEGYNCSLFAYGQTGSGKSYSVMGAQANAGLVPRCCEELFKNIDSKKTTGISYEVTFSMLEIYNEEVRDLLNKKKTPRGGHKVKESVQRGFYVEGLSVVPVGSYRDINVRMKEGDRQRTIASTKMNETSSRAHTIVAITFAQIDKSKKTTKMSTINLVDLAGSERVKQTEATGDRFEEAKNINKSLMTLGSVIKALCDKTKNKSTSIHIPYRDAILTKLLKNALGGNSKTVMIAAISPDAENYEQTLSTLRYADRAKAIKTEARVNQEATNKIIQELIAEKERLLKELEGAKHGGSTGYSKDDIEQMKLEQQKEIERYREQMEDKENVWQKRLEGARLEMEEMLAREKRQEEQEKKMPHFTNLNEDPALMGKLVHLCRPGTLKIGNSKEGSTPDIALNGPRLAKEHAVVVNKDGEVTLEPVNGMVLHNGQEVTKKLFLKHQDRIRFGSNNLFVFIHPKEAEALKKQGRQQIDITYEFAQNEIGKHSGLNFSSENTILQDEVMSMMQMVNDVNAMAEDMDKPIDLSIILVSAEARGLDTGRGRTEVYVKVHDQETDNEYMWDKNKFLNRQVHMQELYHVFEETGNVHRVDKEKDPFWEPYDTEVIVGVATVPLSYLSHMLEFQEEPLTIVDYEANQTGFIKVDLIPCDTSGNEDVDLCVDDAMDLVGKSMAFKIKVIQSFNLSERLEKTWCRYKFYDDPHFIKTNTGSGKNPVYNHEHLITFRKRDVDHKLIEYLDERSIAVEVWGRQGQGRTGSSTSKHKRQNEKQRLQDQVKQLQDKLDRIRVVVQDKNDVAKQQIAKVKKILDS